VIIKLNSRDKKRAEEEVDQMCKELLANPIIEDYHFKISEE
jgi:phosphoribosylformylglycinamidine synthase